LATTALGPLRVVARAEAALHKVVVLPTVVEQHRKAGERHRKVEEQHRKAAERRRKAEVQHRKAAEQQGRVAVL
jgi:membrane protein involved in colicin uptake